MLVTTASPCWRAILQSDRWPAWRLPIVGTNATRPLSRSRNASSAAVVTMSMRLRSRVGCPASDRSEAMLLRRERSVPHCCNVRGQRCVDAGVSGHEIANESCRTAGLDSERVVDYQHLARAERSGADADHGYAGGPGQRLAERTRDAFHDEQRRAGRDQRPPLLHQRGRGIRGLALDSVAAERMNRLRQQAD